LEAKVHIYRWFGVLIGLLLVFSGCQPATETPVEANAATPTPRPPAPDFALETLNGETLRLADYEGQVVLVNFWASWCPPCKEEMPALEAYYQAYKDEGLMVLGVNVKDSEESLEAFLEEYDVSFPVILDHDAKVAGKYNITGLPTSFFVDREGQIIGSWPGMVTQTFLEKNVTPFLEE
jgi:peroxiredoxin